MARQRKDECEFGVVEPQRCFLSSGGESLLGGDQLDATQYESVAELLGDQSSESAVEEPPSATAEPAACTPTATAAAAANATTFAATVYLHPSVAV